MPNVSVVIPTRNRCALLVHALQSVGSQTVLPHQIVVVDDASEDETASAVRQFAALPVQYIRRESAGGGARARNAGIHSTTGDLVAFLDDDDQWAPTKLEEQLALLEASHDAGLCYTGKRVILDRRGRSYYSFKRPRFASQQKSIMADNFIGTTSSVLVRRSVLTDIGGFDEALPAFQDYDLCIRIVRKCPVVGIDKPLVDYDMTDSPGHVSFDWLKIRSAMRHLLGKYRNEEDYRLLRWAMVRVCLKKALKSRRFAVGALVSIVDILRPGGAGA